VKLSADGPKKPLKSNAVLSENGVSRRQDEKLTNQGLQVSEDIVTVVRVDRVVNYVRAGEVACTNALS